MSGRLKLLVILVIMSIVVVFPPGVALVNLPTPVNASPNCVVSLSISGDITVLAGSSGSNTETFTLLSGTCIGPVALNGCTGLPSGASCSVVPSFPGLIPPYSATLTVSTSPSTPDGTYSIGIEFSCKLGTCPRMQGGTIPPSFNLIVQSAAPPPPTPPIVTVTPTAQSVSQGSVATYTVDVAYGTIAGASFDLTVSGLPSGASYAFGAKTVTTDATGHATTTLQIDAKSTPMYCSGSYSFTVTATSGTNIGTSSATALTVNQVGPPLQVSVYTDKTAYRTGDSVTVSISVTRPAEGQVTVTGPSGSPTTYPFTTSSSGSAVVATFTAQTIGTYTVSAQTDDYCSNLSNAQTTFAVGPNTYDATISLSGIPSQYSSTLQVDNQNQGKIQGSQTKTLSFPIASTHTITVDQYVDGDTGVRYYCSQNSWSVSAANSNTFNYQTQYQLSVTADPSTVTQVSGGDWFNAGDSAQTSQAPQTVPGPTGVQYVFENWSVDGAAQNGNQITVTMNGPHTAVAKYKIQYLLTVNSAGGLGNPQGGGYYDAGSTAQFSVTSPVGILIQQVFVQWQGDYSGTSAQGSITMDKPHVVNAIWSTSYLPLIAIIVVAVAIVGGLLFWRSRRGPPPETKPPSTSTATTASVAAGTEAVKCHKCGAENPSDNEFCTNCGEELKHTHHR